METRMTTSQSAQNMQSESLYDKIQSQGRDEERDSREE